MTKGIYRTLPAVVIGALVAVSFGQAQAQTTREHFTAQQLQAISQAQSKAEHRNWGPPPPQSSIAMPKIYPLKGLWVCRSAPFGTPIYQRPSTSAKIIGRSIGWVAVGGAYVGSYQRVLVHRGEVGYMQRHFIKPFHDKLAPSATCEVQGTEKNGMVGYFIK